jgi:SMC interacting uncharacterized protein involved in chromosome segregation
MSNKSIYPPMTSEERDERLGILLKKEKKIQEEMDILNVEAKANSEAIEHIKKKIVELQKQLQQQGIFSHLTSHLSIGYTHKLNKEIEELQSELAKHKLHDNELFKKVREYVLMLEDILRSKKDINRMFRDSENDNTDGSRLSIINYNYFEICNFIEKHVNGFTFKEPSDYALMHALANEIQRQYLEKNNKEFDFYEKPINFDMLNNAFIAMPIFHSGDTVEAFLEQAKRAEQAKKREIAKLSRRQLAAHNKARISRPTLSLVHPDLYKAPSKSYSSNPIVKKSKSRTTNSKKPGGTRRSRRSRKSKK